MNYCDATLLVTGGAGFLGSAFIRYMLDFEQFSGKIVCLDTLSDTANLDALLSVENNPQYFFIKGDICDEDLLRHIHDDYQIDVIVNMAAGNVETNILGISRLLELVVRDPHIHFHHTSSDEVFGSLGQIGMFTEESSFQPSSPYAASKAAQDHLVRAYHMSYDLKTTVSRASNSFGPWQQETKLLPLMIANCVQKRHLPIYGDGGNVRDWIHVDDYVSAIWSIIETGRFGEVYNVSGENQWRTIDLVKLLVVEIAAQTGADPSKYKELITFVADKPQHDLRYALDASKIKNELGWKAKKEFIPAIQETISWHLEQMEVMA